MTTHAYETDVVTWAHEQGSLNYLTWNTSPRKQRIFFSMGV